MIVRTPVVFVSCRWAADYQPINNRIKELIERSGMLVSPKMEQYGVIPVALKESINIMDSHAVCIIVTPTEGQIVTEEQSHEIATARTSRIPAFIFVDSVTTGDPAVEGTLDKYRSDLNCPGQWIGFRKDALLNGELDDRILGDLKEVKAFIQLEYPKIQHRLEAATAVLWAVASDMEPFHVGLHRIAAAYTEQPAILYDAAAEAAAKITGAEFGFVAIASSEEQPPEVSLRIRGFWGTDVSAERAIRRFLQQTKLGYSHSGETLGVTGHVLRHGLPILKGHIQSQQDAMHKEGIAFVDPANAGVESELCVPISIKGRTVGVLDVESGIENRFKTVHQKILEWLAEVLAIAYVGEQLESFVGDLAEGAIRGHCFYDKILAALCQWSQADAGFIALLDDTGRCPVHAIKGTIIDPKVKALAKAGQLEIDPQIGLAGRVLQEGHPIYTTRPESEASYAKWFEHVKAEIVLPIRSGERSACRTIGVVDLEFVQGQDFENVDKDLFQNLANVLALVCSAKQD
jgi:putative methionine-R-sulfoxide reductase with GAF domain